MEASQNTSTPPDKTVELAFAPGANQATVEDVLDGAAIHDYLVRASAGQTRTASLDADGPALILVIAEDGYQPDAVEPLDWTVNEFRTERVGGQEVTAGWIWEGAVPRDGEYRVRVIHSGPAVNGGARSDYELTVGIE